MKRLVPLLLVFTLLACTSSGGDGVSGPARVSIDVTPARIDTGDRTFVTIVVTEPTVDNIILKISIPTELTYVENSSFLVKSDVLVDTGPTENSDGFLGYFFYEADFSSSGRVELLFELEAEADLETGTIGVDLDINDPEVSDRIEFDTTAPQYTAQATDDVGVGPAPVVTATE